MAEETKTEVKGVGNAIKHVDQAQAEATAAWAKFSTNFEELTGFKPNQPVNALDVYKIMYATWGEPSGD